METKRNLGLHLNGDEGIVYGTAFSLLTKTQIEIEDSITTLPLLLTLFTHDAVSPSKVKWNLSLPQTSSNVVSFFVENQQTIQLELDYDTSIPFASPLSMTK